jgi:3-dehydroquinate dehydratase-1/3-dehydroquinate dehydratase/shikimate dehydrogenase
MDRNNPHTLCVSIAAATVDQALALAALAEESADVIEIRLDSLASPAVKPFTEKVHKPLLFTNRPAWEGGSYKGDEEKRLQLLIEAAECGAAFIDVELKTDAQLRRRIIAAARQAETRTIISWHDFKTTASRPALESILQEQYRSGAEIGKIVTMAHDFAEVLRVLDLQVPAREMGFPLIAFCMGRAGMISRVATLELGGFMTYAAPDHGLPTAPGQLPASFLKNFLAHFPAHD